MPILKVHIEECVTKLGNGWKEVHLWLDETAKEYWPFTAHRVIRHHVNGVESVRRRWGDEAARAAELHIMADFELDHVPTEAEAAKLCRVTRRADGQWDMPTPPKPRRRNLYNGPDITGIGP